MIGSFFFLQLALGIAETLIPHNGTPNPISQTDLNTSITISSAKTKNVFGGDTIGFTPKNTLAEGDDADLDESDNVRVVVVPLVEVRKVDLARVVDVFGHADVHVLE